MAIDASVPAVGKVVRDAARSSGEALQVDQEALGLSRDRRDQPEERQLRQLARVCLQRPDLISDEMALTLQETCRRARGSRSSCRFFRQQMRAFSSRETIEASTPLRSNPAWTRTHSVAWGNRHGYDALRRGRGR